MKKITLLIILLSGFNFGFGQTTLTAGDIVITGFNSDSPKQFSFVLLTDVLNGTEINFTDNGWLSSGGFRDNEGTVTWTANSDLSCGTEIVVTDNSPFAVTSGSGAVSETNAGFNLSTNGDQILAYQGLDASPIFIYAVHFDTNTGWSANATTPNTSAIPTGLTNGTNAIAINETDNGVYDCSVTSENALILSAVSNSSNWISSGSVLTLGGCTYACSQCLGITTTWDGVTSTWDNGTPGLSDNVILNGNYNTDSAVNGNLIGCSLTVNAGFTLTVADNSFAEIQNDVTVDGNIIVNPQGSFVQKNNLGNVTVTGLIEVEKLTAPMDAWYEYTYWSSPVSGEAVSSAIPDYEPSRVYIYRGQNYLDVTQENNNDNGTLLGQDDIDDNGDDWQPVNGATIMQPGTGYATTISDFAYSIAFGTSNKQFKSTFRGPFNNGIYNVPVYRNDSEMNDNNWNIVGNPYPSAIDVDLFLSANTEIDETNTFPPRAIIGAIYLWSQDSPPSAIANGNQQLNFSDSDYAIINGVTQIAGGDGVAPNNRKIPSGQAFVVSYSDLATPVSISVDGNGHSIAQGVITFDNSMRTTGVTDNSLFFKNSSSKNQSSSVANKIWLNLTSDNGVFNQIALAYVDGATDDNDGSFYDTQKTSAIVTGAILYSNIEGSDKKFGIQAKASNSLDKDETINLGFKSNIGVATLFKLSIDHLEGDFLNENTVYLKDNLLNKSHNLSASDYTFTTEVGEFNERFEIVFNSSALSTDAAVLNTNKFSIVDLDNNSVQFNTNSNLSIKTIRVFDLLGRQLYDLKGYTNSETYSLSNLNNTIYIAKIELSNGTVITKKAIKK